MILRRYECTYKNTSVVLAPINDNLVKLVQFAHNEIYNSIVSITQSIQ